MREGLQEIQILKQSIINRLKALIIKQYKEQGYVSSGSVFALMGLDNSYKKYTYSGAIGAVLLECRSDEQSLIMAREFFKGEARLGRCEEQYQYANMLYHGKGGDVDLAEARAWFKRAAEQGNVPAMKYYAGMLHDGKGGDADLAEARAWYKQAAEQGHVAAMRYYAGMLHDGKGGDIDLVEARAWYKQAAEQGNVHAMRFYAYMLHYGKGGDIDLVEARAWFKRAAEKGCVYAMYNYANMLLYGKGGNVDLVEARALCKQAAEKGNVLAMCQYGVILRQKGRTYNPGSAKIWFQRAATRGSKRAMYMHALTLLQDNPEAAEAESFITQAKSALPIVDFIIAYQRCISDEEFELLLRRMSEDELMRLQCMELSPHLKTIVEHHRSARALIGLGSVELLWQDGGDAPEQAEEPIRKKGKFQAEDGVVVKSTSHAVMRSG